MIRIFLFIIIIFQCTTASAETPCKEVDYFGLAMHGKPKYKHNAKHLDYANPHAPKGGALKQAVIGTFDTLNPYSINGKAAAGLNLVNDRLMSRVWDEPFTMYPNIAQSVTLCEGSRGSITFTLNPNAQFSDGSPITADDILYSFETLKAHGRPNMQQTYKEVAEAKIIDQHTIHFQLKEEHGNETIMILAMMPVLSKAYWSAHDFTKTSFDIPVSSGPYQITKIDPGRSITYKRNPNYWAKDLFQNVGHNNFETMSYTYFRDDTVAFEAFKSGAINIRSEHDASKWASGYNSVPTIEKVALSHQRPERAYGMIFNTRRAPFDDINVRSALNLMFDFDWINTNLYHGLYKQVDSYFPNSELAAPQAKKNHKATTREKLREAKRLLEHAGWTITNNQLQKNGTPFSFELILSSTDEEKLALHFKQTLQKLGIEMNIRKLDSASFRGRLNEYDYDMVIHYWLSSLSPGTEQPLFWSCDASEQNGLWNYPGICDPAVDSLVQYIASTLSRDELVSLTRKLDQTLWDQDYIIPLYYRGEDWFGIHKGFEHPAKIPLYGAVIESWWKTPDAP